MIGHHDERLRLAEKLGANMVVNSGREDLVSIVKRETGGLGVDRVIVAASGKQAIEDALRIVAPAGKIEIFAGTYPH